MNVLHLRCRANTFGQVAVCASARTDRRRFRSKRRAGGHECAKLAT